LRWTRGTTVAATAVGALGTELSATVGHLATSDLERVFWDCDFAATKIQVSLDVGAMCAAATHELLRRTFHGDFDLFVSWWRANKQTQHALRATARTAALDEW